LAKSLLASLRFSLTTRLTLTFALFAIVLLVVVGEISFNSGRQALESAAVAELLSTAVEKQNAIREWSQENTNDLTALAADPGLADYLASFSSRSNGSQDPTIQETVLTQLENWIGPDQKRLSLFAMDPVSGNVILSTDSMLTGNSFVDQPYFQQGKLAAYIGNPFFNPDSQNPKIVASVPVMASTGKLVGVLAAYLNLEQLNVIVQQRNLRNSSDAFLVNTDRLPITRPRYITDPAALKVAIHTEAVDRCLAKQSGSVLAADYRGVPSVIVYRWLDEHQLCLIDKIDQAEAFAPAYNFGQSMLIVSILAILFSLGSAFFISHSITRPVKKLVDGAEQIGQGNLGYRINLKQSDEMGRLGEAFDKMASNLLHTMGENQRLYLETRAWADELEKRVAEQTAAIIESEEHYRTLIEQAAEGIYLADSTGKFLVVNSALCALFGYTHDELLQVNLFETYTPADLAAIQQRLASFSPEQAFRFERQLKRKDGSLILVESSLAKLEDGRLQAILWDITERKRLEEELYKSRQMLQLVFDNIPQRVFWKDKNLTFLGCNLPFANDIGLSSPSVIVGHTDFDHVSPEFAESYRKYDQSVIDTDTPMPAYEELQPTADGRQIWISTSRVPFHDRDGSVIGVLGTYEDISVRKQAEEKLKKALDELSRSNAELERFAYVASHDLQEPLRMVTSYLQLLERRYKDRLDSDAIDFINYAVDGSSRMKTLINDLLTYSRVGTRGKDFTLVDCNEVFRRVLQNLLVAIEENKAQIISDPLPVVTADAVQLEQLFQNLIANAIKFRGSHEPRVQIGVRKESKEWVFSVQDNGIGIDPRYFDRIFVIFQRLHGREQYPGTGIGLAVSKRIVERHGGRIWVESKPGEGSTFFFTFPIIGG
jgi:PAS domain S-box-containing protein